MSINPAELEIATLQAEKGLLVYELRAANQIIRNALAIMTTDQQVVLSSVFGSCISESLTPLPCGMAAAITFVLEAAAIAAARPALLRVKKSRRPDDGWSSCVVPVLVRGGKAASNACWRTDASWLPSRDLLPDMSAPIGVSYSARSRIREVLHPACALI